MDASIATVTTPVAPLRRTAEPAQGLESAPAPVQLEKPPVTTGFGGAELDRLPAQRSVDRDDATGSLVYKLIDVSTGVVAVQTPSDAKLRLRAYIDGVLKSSVEPAVEVRA